jgi:hypothetical protein
LFAIDHRAFAGFKLVQRFCFRVGRQRPDANRANRFGIVFAWAKILTIKIQRLLDAGAVAEKIGESVGQAKVSRQLRAIV